MSQNFLTNDLPNDTILIILTYLPTKDLLNLNLVSKKWNFSNLSSNDLLVKISRVIRKIEY